jgi:hypothetical protein
VREQQKPSRSDGPDARVHVRPAWSDLFETGLEAAIAARLGEVAGDLLLAARRVGARLLDQLAHQLGHLRLVDAVQDTPLAVGQHSSHLHMGGAT